MRVIQVTSHDYDYVANPPEEWTSSEPGIVLTPQVVMTAGDDEVSFYVYEQPVSKDAEYVDGEAASKLVNMHIFRTGIVKKPIEQVGAMFREVAKQIGEEFDAGRCH